MISRLSDNGSPRAVQPCDSADDKNRSSALTPKLIAAVPDVYVDMCMCMIYIYIICCYLFTDPCFIPFMCISVYMRHIFCIHMITPYSF